MARAPLAWQPGRLRSCGEWNPVESGAATDLARQRALSSLVGFGCPLLESTMRSLAVVVVDVNAEYAFEVTAVENQQPVKTFGTHGPNKTLRDRVCLRRSHRRPHDPDAL